MAKVRQLHRALFINSKWRGRPRVSPRGICFESSPSIKVPALLASVSRHLLIPVHHSFRFTHDGAFTLTTAPRPETSPSLQRLEVASSLSVSCFSLPCLKLSSAVSPFSLGTSQQVQLQFMSSPSSRRKLAIAHHGISRRVCLAVPGRFQAVWASPMQ